MNILFVHQNFPGQYRHLAVALAGDEANRVVALGEETRLRQAAGLHPRLTLVPYARPLGAGKHTHHYLRDTEAAVRRGQQVARVAIQLKQGGFLPDVICAHPGWGEALFLREVFPQARIVLFAEFFYRAEGADIGFDAEQHPADLDSRLRARVKNATQLMSFEAADRAVAPTGWQASRYPGFIREKLSVIHDGIDTALAAPDPAASFVVGADGPTFRPGDEVVTYVARNLEPYRGFHIFMRALPDLLQRRPRAQVVIVGGDEVSYGRRLPDGKTHRQALLAEVGAQIDPARVHSVGRLPYARYLSLLQVSAVHVYLTYPFVLSWSMLEAMACGAPLVASATPPVQEVLADGENGLLFDFFSPPNLVDQVVRALEYPTATARRRDAARATVVERYDLVTRCLPAQLDLIGGLMRKPG